MGYVRLCLTGDVCLYFINDGEREAGVRLHGSALLLRAIDAVFKFWLLAHTEQCLAGGILLRFLLGIPLSVGCEKSFDDDACDKDGSCSAVAFLLIVEMNFQAVFLAILQQFAFEVHFFLRHALQIEASADDLLLNETEGVAETTVEIDGSH